MLEMTPTADPALPSRADPQWRPGGLPIAVAVQIEPAPGGTLFLATSSRTWPGQAAAGAEKSGDTRSVIQSAVSRRAPGQGASGQGASGQEKSRPTLRVISTGWERSPGSGGISPAVPVSPGTEAARGSRGGSRAARNDLEARPPDLTHRRKRTLLYDSTTRFYASVRRCALAENNPFVRTHEAA